MVSRTSDSAFDKDYYEGVFWHGTTVGWLATEGFRTGMNQFGETLSAQSFIWLHANQQRARDQAETSLGEYENRIKAGWDDPFRNAPHKAAKYVYRVGISPCAKQLDMWAKYLGTDELKKVIRAVNRTCLRCEPGRWLITSPIKALGWAWGHVGTRPRDRLFAEPNGWFKWLHRELGLGQKGCGDNERWRRLALFCESADVDVIKHPKAGYHLNGCEVHNDADYAAEWAIMNLQREVKDPKTGKTQRERTYEILGAYAMWPQK